MKFFKQNTYKCCVKRRRKEGQEWLQEQKERRQERKRHREKGIGGVHGQKEQVWKLKFIGCIFFVFLYTDI